MELLNPKLLEFYYHCESKAYLTLSSNQTYLPTSYESILQKIEERTIQSFLEKHKTIDFYEGILRKGFEGIANVKINAGILDLECRLLLKETGNSMLGNFSYTPVIFLGTNKISKAHKMTLAFIGLALEKVQGVYPGIGTVVKKNGKLSKIKIRDLKNEVEEAIRRICNFKNIQPRIFLNSHCGQCSFQKKCKEEMLNAGSLSLLSSIGTNKIKKYESTGIFNIIQLSYLHKPRRRRKYKFSKVRLKPEIQALAIRTQKTYVQELPAIKRETVEIFLDIESIPDENFFYLFGILLVEQGKKRYHSFWANAIEEQKPSFLQVIDFLKSYKRVPIYHYGNYEAYVFQRLSKLYNIEIQSLKSRFINVNHFIYGKIYFPAYSNKLKELANILGFKWSRKESSGLECIVWRRMWEEGNKDSKNTILTYNNEDCLALYILLNELTRIKESSNLSDDIDFTNEPKQRATGIGKNLQTQFKIVLKLAHHEYDKKKIRVDFNRNEVIKPKKKSKKISGKYHWLGKSISKPSKSIMINADHYCYKHTERTLTKTKIQSKRVKVDLVFGKNGIRKTVVEYIGHHGYCPICNNTYASQTFRKISRDLYGHNLKSWIVFQRIEIQLPFSKINQSLAGMINEKIGSSSGVEFIKHFSELYQETEKEIIENLRESPVIHIDETVVSIRGANQYVWILTSQHHTTYLLTETRDSIAAKNLLKGYKGILVSDFYAGYDSFNCKQQKCWVHLIRDINNDLWKNPLDSEYEKFVIALRNVIIPILQSTYRFGLKNYHLKKYYKSIEKFFMDYVDNRYYTSDICLKYQKRFKRYRDSLFIFLKFDGVPWHNNAAENKVRHICVQRKISGSFGADQFPHYLRMVSIMQTCQLQKKSFLNFLLSKEPSIEHFNSIKVRGTR